MLMFILDVATIKVYLERKTIGSWILVLTIKINKT
jgi:hypothetical protein